MSPGVGWVVLNLRELWKYRELIFFLSWRDVKVRYKQAVLGAAWVVIQPLVQMVVFTLLFNKTLGVESPIAGVTLHGLQPHRRGAVAVLHQFAHPRHRQPGGAGLAADQGLLSPVGHTYVVHVHRSGGPAASPWSYGVMMAAYGIAPGWQLVFFPLFILLALLTAWARVCGWGPSTCSTAMWAASCPSWCQADVLEHGHLPLEQVQQRGPQGDRLAQPHDGGHRRLPLGVAGAELRHLATSGIRWAWSRYCWSPASSSSSAWNGCSRTWCRP